MLDKTGENASDTEQEKSVNKYFQFHLKKGTECSSHENSNFYLVP